MYEGILPADKKEREKVIAAIDANDEQAHQSREPEMISNCTSGHAKSGQVSADQVPIRLSCARPVQIRPDHTAFACAMLSRRLWASSFAMQRAPSQVNEAAMVGIVSLL